jgi:GntR family transcriptional repressor for pyruvate dehydrogenase complex
MTSLFKPVKSIRIAEDLTTQIIQNIIKKKLRPGDKLPSERKLAEMCAVSRVTVREALRILENKGLVIIKRGAKGGAFITEVNIETVEDSLIDFFQFGDVSIDHISEARLIIEPTVAEIAAVKRTKKNLKEIQEILSYCQELIDNGRALVDAQVKFHLALARASGNPVIIAISNSLMNFLAKKLLEISPSTKSFTMDQEFHLQIFEAINNQEGKLAFQAMKEHVQIFKAFHQEELNNKYQSKGDNLSDNNKYIMLKT